jgi:hypothetical protein
MTFLRAPAGASLQAWLAAALVAPRLTMAGAFAMALLYQLLVGWLRAALAVELVRSVPAGTVITSSSRFGQSVGWILVGQTTPSRPEPRSPRMPQP